MKKILVLALTVLFCLVMSGCSCSWFATTIPEGFTVFNINLGGMTEDEAKEALRTGIEGYTVNATISGDTFPVSGAQIGVKYNESYNLDDMVKRTNDGSLTASMIENEIIVIDDDYQVEEGLREAHYAGLILYQTAYSAKIDEDVAKAAEAAVEAATEESSSEETTENVNVDAYKSAIQIDENLSKEQIEKKIAEYDEKIKKVYDSTRAHIEFNEKELTYVSVDGVAGDTQSYAKAVSTLKTAAKKFSSNVTLMTESSHSDGEIAANIPAIKTGVETGNKYLTLKIEYNFDVPEGERVTETLDRSNIHTMLYIAPNGREVLIDEASLSLYAADITNKNAKITSTDTMNEDKTFTTTRSGKSADANVVYNDIYGAMEKFESKSFEAVYSDVNETITSENGSVYVYIDLDEQKVYLYENGKVTVTTDCVSGCVSSGRSTPTGVYSIYYKARNQTLRGPGYASFVNYWMPFNGGIGLHDADGWRSAYGGTYYLYGGSHGCINMPKWAAAAIYEKVNAGTRVIVVGGQQSTYRANDNAVSTTAATKATTAAATPVKNNSQNNANNANNAQNNVQNNAQNNTQNNEGGQQNNNTQSSTQAASSTTSATETSPQ